MTIPITFNTQYLNRTENKDERSPTDRYIAIVWHETQNGSGNAHSSLNWNLQRKVGSSYDFLIARDGTIFQYLDYHIYTSWDTGVSEWTIDGNWYVNWALNSITLGVELDGPCDGTPITPAQLDAAARLAIFLNQTEGIKLDRDHQLTHAEIAKHRTTNKRTDPQGYSPEQILTRAKMLIEPDYAALWGTSFEFHPDWGIETAWKRQAATLGAAVSEETRDQLGRVWRLFAFGAIAWSPAETVVYVPRTKQ